VVVTAPLCGSPRPRVIHQNASHDVGGGAEEMRAVLPVFLSLVIRSTLRFVNERRGLQRMVRALCPHVAGRHAVELSIDEVKQLRFNLSLPRLEAQQ
jgi:hypothetical protein